MSHPRSILVYPLLILIQLFSPWVHAHTGCETGGVLHIPGLERMQGQADTTSAQAADMLVGVQSGIEQTDYRLDRLVDSNTGVFLNLSLLAEPMPRVLSIRENITGSAFHRINAHLGLPPRASPSSIHL